MDKFFKNPKYMGIIAVVTLVVILLFVWDTYKNPRRDFYGLLKSSTPAA